MLTINDIDEYSLIIIFNLLNVREKIAIERVCIKWHKIIGSLLIQQKGLKLSRIPHWMACNDSNHSTNGGDICDYLNYPNNEFKVKKILITIFRKCPNIKCIELKWSSVELKEGLKLFSWLLWLCPNLQCLRVYVNDKKINHGFGKAIELMGNNLTHLAAYQSSNWVTNPSNINLLLKSMPNLQQLVLLGFRNTMQSSLELGLNIKELVTDCCSQSNIDQIVRCKRMKKLQIFGALDQFGFQSICHNMPQMKCLTARFNESVHDFSPLLEIKDLKKFGLSNINYYELQDISSAKMVFFKKNQVFSDLRKTSQSFVNTISVNEFAFKRLRSLAFYGISISRNMLNVLCEELPYIQELDLNKFCFRCECVVKKKSCNVCQEECCALLSKWPNLKRLSFEHPENEVLIRYLPTFSQLRSLVINHVRLYPNNRFYLANDKPWRYCYDIFLSCYLMASQTKDQIRVDLNIHLDNIIRIDLKTPKNLSISFNYFSNNTF
jgi:hypothetical protein